MDFLNDLKAKYRITAEPLLVDTFTHGLDEEAQNRDLFTKLLSSPSVLIHEFVKGVELRLYDTVIALTDAFSSLPVAFVYFFVVGNYRGKPAIHEKFLWKDIDNDHADVRLDGERLPVYSVLKVFLQKHTVFVSDQKHTVFGYEWWDRFVKNKALPAGLYVYVENEHGALIKVTAETYDKKYKKLMWGTEPKYLNRKLIISRVDLQE